MSDHSDFMSTEQVRLWLGLGKTKMQELLSSGAIPSYRIGRVRRIRREDVVSWLEEHRQDARR